MNEAVPVGRLDLKEEWNYLIIIMGALKRRLRQRWTNGV